MFNFNSILVVVIVILKTIFLFSQSNAANILKTPTDDELKQIWESFKTNQSKK